MKFKLKSAFILRLTAGFALLLLTGCSDDLPAAPHVFNGNEVPQELINQPRVVTVPPELNRDATPWPRLGDVPSKPNNFSPPPVIDQAMDEMEFDREQGRSIERDYEATHPDIVIKQGK